LRLYGLSGQLADTPIAPIGADEATGLGALPNPLLARVSDLVVFVEITVAVVVLTIAQLRLRLAGLHRAIGLAASICPTNHDPESSACADTDATVGAHPEALVHYAVTVVVCHIAQLRRRFTRSADTERRTVLFALHSTRSGAQPHANGARVTEPEGLVHAPVAVVVLAITAGALLGPGDRVADHLLPTTNVGPISGTYAATRGAWFPEPEALVGLPIAIVVDVVTALGGGRGRDTVTNRGAVGPTDRLPGDSAGADARDAGGPEPEAFVHPPVGVIIEPITSHFGAHARVHQRIDDPGLQLIDATVPFIGSRTIIERHDRIAFIGLHRQRRGKLRQAGDE